MAREEQEIRYPDYPLFKGLQKPLEFMGIQGRYIYWAAATAGGAIIGFIAAYCLMGIIAGLIVLVVEGIYSAKAALALAKKYDVELPIIEEVNKVLFDDKPAKEGVKDLMVREKRVEHLNLKWEN